MFTPRKQIHGDVKYGLIDNSQNLSIGEVIIPGVQGDTSVVLTGGGTTGFLLGVVMGLRDNAGSVLELNSKAVASDNVTVAKIEAAYVPLHLVGECLTELDDTGEVTDNSTAFGNFAVDATGLLADESTWVAYSTRTAVQLFSYGLTTNVARPKELTCVFFATIAGGL